MTLSMKLKEERQIGELLKVVSSVRECKDEMTEEWMSRVFHIEQTELKAIIEMIDSNPDWTDEEIAEDILGYTE